jgi:redox-sensitive bicupin YhaK (pirin superfamily)
MSFARIRYTSLAAEITARFGVFRGQRLVGLWQVFTGIWLMYLDLRHRIQYRPGQALVGLESHPHAGLDNLHERV